MHKTVLCDDCGDEIMRGFRFKCLDCPDFELCASCETTNFHSGHLIARFVKPRNEVITIEPLRCVDFIMLF